jgi:2-polyprenyl-3-methyl-5-hydroxy-6-metoxy-1,4-benzoquinol methylase
MADLNQTIHSSGFAVNAGRRNKAMKIVEILRENTERTERLSLLDIGTGNGEIAKYLSEFFNVVSVDVVDQRVVQDGFKFVQVEGEDLPFADQSFDVVVSNHVIEHMANADKHLSETGRVLKDGGIAYLATPNRLWPWEAHNKIYLLHYLPAAIFNRLLKRLGRYREDIYLLTWWTLNQKMKKTYSVHIVSDRICKWPLKYHMQCSPFLAKILSFVPLQVYRMFTFINPTLVVVLKKTNQLS